MRRVLTLGLLLLLPVVGFAQDSGRLTLSVQASADPTIPATRVAGAKVMVVHWSRSQLDRTMIQDQVATTNAQGTCSLDLAPGVYDIFISTPGFSPAAFRREVSVGESTPLVVRLKAAPLRLHPVGREARP